MIPLIAPLFAVFHCILVTIFFEAFYAALKKDPTITFSKPSACIGCWTFTGIISLVLLIMKYGWLALLLNIPCIVVVAVSHYQLAMIQDAVISIKDVATNIPSAARTCIAWLRTITHK